MPSTRRRAAVVLSRSPAEAAPRPSTAGTIGDTIAVSPSMTSAVPRQIGRHTDKSLSVVRDVDPQPDKIYPCRKVATKSIDRVTGKVRRRLPHNRGGIDALGFRILRLVDQKGRSPGLQW